MSEKATYHIDGAAFSDLAGFLDEVERQMLADVPWGRTLDELDEVLRGGFGPMPREFRLVWEHSDLSRRRLGTTGPGSFTDLLHRIAQHQNVEVVLS